MKREKVKKKKACFTFLRFFLPFSGFFLKFISVTSELIKCIKMSELMACFDKLKKTSIKESIRISLVTL